MKIHIPRMTTEGYWNILYEIKESDNPDKKLTGVLMQVYERLTANPIVSHPKTWYPDALCSRYEKKISRLPFDPVLFTFSSLGGVTILTKLTRRDFALETVTMLLGTEVGITFNLPKRR